MHLSIQSKYTKVDNTNIHYLIAGKGETILFIHGFPTSAYLWRNVMSELADKFQVIAIDLPGYGKSDKKPDDSYSFRYYDRMLTGFLDNLKIDTITLGVHDFGGPIGLYWMVQHMERVSNLLLFNTLVYPQFSWAVKLFGLAVRLPLVSSWLTSATGIKQAMHLGVYNSQNLTDEIIREYQSPFPTKESRKVLQKTVLRQSMKGFFEIQEKLPAFKGGVQIIYGENDKILPKVKNTMEKVKQDLPQANIVSLTNCGHFLQEDEPQKIAAVIDDFMARG